MLRILHYRLLVAASLKEYRLILECFHPSSKLTEPHVFCDYLGTDGLSDRHEGQGSLYENVETAQHLARLSALYSRFRPRAQPDDEAAVRRVDESPLSSSDPSPPSGNRAVMLPGVVGYLRPKPKRRDDGAAVDEHSVKRIVSLDESEDFSQLCVVANIVKVLRGSNLLLSAVTVEDGIVRIWRKWLKDRVSQSQLADAQTGLDLELDSSQARHRPSAMLWVDEGKNVGLKLRVEEKRWNRNRPVLMHRDEEPLVSYQVEIQGTTAWQVFGLPF